MSERVRELSVGTPQGIAGSLIKDSRYVFNYGTKDRQAEVSLTMPIRPESYGNAVLQSVFAMNRPEGLVLERIRAKLGKSMKLDDMQLLAITGGNQIGRLQYTLPDTSIAKRKTTIDRAEIERAGNSAELFEYLADLYFDSGISGVQPKVLVPETPTTQFTDRATLVHSNLIVKSAGDQYPFLTENEFLCMTAAKRAGIEAADFSLSDDGKLFIMDRFDLNGERRLGFEDMAVLTGRQPDQKYLGGYEQIAQVITMYCRDNQAESLQRLFEYLALSVMVRNGDAHLKNFGLLYDWPLAADAPRLAPLFDVVTTAIYEHVDTLRMTVKFDDSLALNLNKTKRYPIRPELIDFGKKVCHVRNPSDVLDRIAEAMQTTLTDFSDLLDQSHGKRLQGRWNEGMAVAYQYTRKDNVSGPTPSSGMTP